MIANFQRALFLHIASLFVMMCAPIASAENPCDKKCQEVEGSVAGAGYLGVDGRCKCPCDHTKGFWGDSNNKCALKQDPCVDPRVVCDIENQQPTIVFRLMPNCVKPVNVMICVWFPNGNWSPRGPVEVSKGTPGRLTKESGLIWDWTTDGHPCSWPKPKEPNHCVGTLEPLQ